MYQMFHCSKFTLGSSLELAAATPRDQLIQLELAAATPAVSSSRFQIRSNKGGGFKLLSGAKRFQLL